MHAKMYSRNLCVREYKDYTMTALKKDWQWTRIGREKEKRIWVSIVERDTERKKYRNERQRHKK